MAFSQSEIMYGVIAVVLESMVNVEKAVDISLRAGKVSEGRGLLWLE